MPCYTPDDPEEDERLARERFRHDSDVAELLCLVCKEYETDVREGVPRGAFPSKVLKWWAEHKERDRIKAKEEREARGERIKRARRESYMANAKLVRLLKKGK